MKRPRLVRLSRNRGAQITKLAENLERYDRIFTDGGTARIVSKVTVGVKNVYFAASGVEIPYTVNLYRKIGDLVPVVLEL